MSVIRFSGSGGFPRPATPRNLVLRQVCRAADSLGTECLSQTRMEPGTCRSCGRLGPRVGRWEVPLLRRSGLGSGGRAGGDWVAESRCRGVSASPVASRVGLEIRALRFQHRDDKRERNCPCFRGFLCLYLVGRGCFFVPTKIRRLVKWFLTRNHMHGQCAVRGSGGGGGVLIKGAMSLGSERSAETTEKRGKH